MITSFYTASVGTMQIQKGMDVVANNIANLSTTGYKPSTSSFSDLLYTNIHGDETLDQGHGVKLQKTDILQESGPMRRTERNLDYALPDKNAFFALQTPAGITYTKNGEFSLSEVNGNHYLVSSTGAFVLDQAGKPIATTATELEAGKNALPGAYAFRNPDGLTRAGNNSDFLATAASGAATPMEGADVRQGYLETSAVDLATEMSDVIQLQRAFQLNTRMVQISDEVLQTINTLR